MFVLENFKNINKIFIKDSNYIVLIGDNSLFLKNICDGIYSYIEDIKLPKRDDDKKIFLSDYETGNSITKVDKKVIYLSSNELEDEISIGSKTKSYSILSDFFKKNIPIEPALLTLNSLFNSLEDDESILKLEKELNKFSELNLKLNFSSFTYSDIIKKIDFKFFDKNSEEKNFENISYFEKLKIKLSLYDIENEYEKIYILFFPENNLSIFEIKKLKTFLNNLSEKNKIILATSNFYLFSDNVHDINIFNQEILSNNLTEEELVTIIYEEYPYNEEKEIILEELNMIIKKYFLNFIGEELYFTNKKNHNNLYTFISNSKELFFIYSYLKNQNFKFKFDLDFSEENIFMNYLKNHCN